MANIQGVPSNITPSVIVTETTVSSGVSVPGGTRTAVLMGEGKRSETLVTSATGKGQDGFNPTYTSTNGSDGRHFVVTTPPVVSNRSTVFKNGIPLSGLEQAFDSSTGSFSSLYDYRLNITTGQIELQTASLVDQGGTFYLPYILNVGNGLVNGLSLVDPSAPTETWTVRCSSTKRDGYGNPISGNAKFIAQGSVSGTLLDGYGNQVIWQSNGASVSNSVLQFSISEGSTPFREGDKFTIGVKGGSLTKGDSLTISYIAETDLNIPVFFTDPNQIYAKHGSPSLSNFLSLGAQLTFANSPPGVWTCQTAPSIPRRVSYLVEDKASGGATLDDLTFPLPLNVIPDVNSNINFFVTNASTGVETQILYNKVDFYDPTFTQTPADFILGGAHVFSYTVVLETAVTKEAEDGVVTPIGGTSATLSSVLVTFTSDDVGKILQIEHPNHNVGTYGIASVSGGIATISNGSTVLTSETAVKFEVLDNTAQSAKILLTSDVALGAGQKLRVTVVDTKDADFFDAGWETALASIETIDVDMVVPLPSQTISAIFTATKNHCLTMSQPVNALERVMLTGAINGLTPDNLIGNSLAAVEDIGILEGIQGDTTADILDGDTEDLANYSVPAAYGNTFRVIYFYPDQIVVQIGANRSIVSGYFIAAAAAGYLSGVSNIAIPLTNKTLAGFTILQNKVLRPIILQNLSAAGVAVITPVTGGGNVVWGRTTTQSGFVEEQELSIVFIRDRIAKTMRASLKSFVGAAQDPSIIGSLMARVNGLMQSFITQGLITAFANIKVIQDSVEADQINVSASVVPTYALNYINISISIGQL